MGDGGGLGWGGWGGQRGLKIIVKAKKLGSHMVMVETSIHSEFPAAVPCLSPLDYFLVQGLLHFKASSLPTSLLQGLYFSTHHLKEN